MATILRPTKVGGTRLYVTEVQNGFDLIREDEVDHDLNIVYGEFNGGIDNDNILVPPHTGPRIEYAKLDLFHKLQGSDFDPASSTGLPPSAFPPGGIPAGALPPITGAMLAVGAPTFYLNSVGGSTPVNIVTGTEQMILETTFTFRDPLAYGFAIGVISGWMPLVAAVTTFVGQFRIDGTAGVATDGTVLGGNSTQSQHSATGANSTALGMTLAQGLHSLSAGTHRLKMTGQVSALAANALSYQILIATFA